jgi:hypothetical protein
MQNEVVTLKEDDHRVKFQGKLTTRQFTSKGAALSYLIALAAGKQQPEFIIGYK